MVAISIDMSQDISQLTSANDDLAKLHSRDNAEVVCSVSRSVFTELLPNFLDSSSDTSGLLEFSREIERSRELLEHIADELRDLGNALDAEAVSRCCDNVSQRCILTEKLLQNDLDGFGTLIDNYFEQQHQGMV